MPVGARVGVKVGQRAGAAVGVSGDPIAPRSGLAVDRDATSLIYLPSSAAQWTALLAAAGISSGNPSALWLMQEASGNPADSIGSFTLTAAGTPTYQQAVAGWTRTGILFDNGTTDALTSASASLPNLTSASQMVLAIVRMPTAAPAAARAVVSIGGSGTRFVAQVNTTPRLEARHSANVATGTANAADSAVHPIVLRHNDTASEADLCTDAEKLSPTWSAVVAGQGVLFGNAGNLAPNMTVLYAASFHGAAAEMTDAQIKTLLQTMGFTVAW